MRIRTGPDFQIQCIRYGKQQFPDCAVRIAVKRALCCNVQSCVHVIFCFVKLLKLLFSDAETFNCDTAFVQAHLSMTLA